MKHFASPAAAALSTASRSPSPAGGRGRAGLRLRPYRPGDEAGFTARPDMAAEATANAYDWRQGPPGPTWTIIGEADDEVIGIGGAIPGEDGAWLAWACLAEVPARAWPELMRLAGVVVDHMLRRPDVRWLWAQARTERRGGRRCLERLGFRLHHVETIPVHGAEVFCMLREG